MFQVDHPLGYAIIIAIILLATKLCGLLFRKLKLPEVLGFIIAGSFSFLNSSPHTFVASSIMGYDYRINEGMIYLNIAYSCRDISAHARTRVLLYHLLQILHAFFTLISPFPHIIFCSPDARGKKVRGKCACTAKTRSGRASKKASGGRRKNFYLIFFNIFLICLLTTEFACYNKVQKIKTNKKC